MRWIFVHCILLVTAANVISRDRPKRDLSYIKNFIGSKLFGTETIVIQQPKIPENERYQLFKIKGYDNILLKVIRKSKQGKEQAVTEKTQDPVMVSPEIAIIGNYLGTSTQGETLIAIETAKNLLKSGILSDEQEKILQEVVIPKTPQLYSNYNAGEPTKSINILTEDGDPIYLPGVSGNAERIKVYQGIHNNPVPVFSAEYQPLVVASEIKYRPLGNKYSYKQKGETADMTYESYNNQDVIVSRTIKEPPLPQYIKLRFADVVSIGVDPYFIRSQQPVSVIPEDQLVQPMNIEPGPYGSWIPSIVVQDDVPAPISTYVFKRLSVEPKPVPNFGVLEEYEYIGENNNKPHIITEKNSTFYSKRFNVPNFNNNQKKYNDIKDNLSELINLGENSKNAATVNLSSSNGPNKENKIIKEENKSYESSGQVKSNNQETKSLHKQMNLKSSNSAAIADPLKFDQNFTARSHTDKSLDEVPKNFVYIPPKNVNTPLPSSIPKTNNIHALKNNKSEDKGNYPEAFFNQVDKSKANGNIGMEILKTNYVNYLKKSPIRTIKSDHQQRKENAYHENRTHFTPFLGGQVF